jgi:hypothetical protein
VTVPGGGYQSSNYGGGYQGLGYYGAPPEPPKPKKNNALIISLIVLVVVAIGVTATLLFLGNKDGENQAGSGQTTTTGPPPSTKSSAPKTTTPSRDPLAPGGTAAPQVPGWKVVPVDDGNDLKTSKAYDVPPTWAVMIGPAGFEETPTKQLQVFVPTVFMRGFCAESPNSFRSMAGLIIEKERDGAKAAISSVTKLANAVYTVDGVKPKVEVQGQPQPVTIDRDKKAYLLSAKVDAVPSKTNKCATGGPAVVTVAAIPPKADENDSIVITAFGDQGFKEATPSEYLEKIVLSLHAA